MYQVMYRYYNYEMRQKAFDTYAAAKQFFYTIKAQKGVRYAELVPVETA